MMNGEGTGRQATSSRFLKMRRVAKARFTVSPWASCRTGHCPSQTLSRCGGDGLSKALLGHQWASIVQMVQNTGHLLNGAVAHIVLVWSPAAPQLWRDDGLG